MVATAPETTASPSPVLSASNLDDCNSRRPNFLPSTAQHHLYLTEQNVVGIELAASSSDLSAVRSTNMKTICWRSLQARVSLKCL